MIHDENIDDEAYWRDLRIDKAPGISLSVIVGALVLIVSLWVPVGVAMWAIWRWS